MILFYRVRLSDRVMEAETILLNSRNVVGELDRTFKRQIGKAQGIWCSNIHWPGGLIPFLKPGDNKEKTFWEGSAR